ncbi:putative leader peptide [Streptomyces sp. NPDC051776]
MEPALIRRRHVDLLRVAGMLCRAGSTRAAVCR